MTLSGHSKPPPKQAAGTTVSPEIPTARNGRVKVTRRRPIELWRKFVNVACELGAPDARYGCRELAHEDRTIENAAALFILSWSKTQPVVAGAMKFVSASHACVSTALPAQPSCVVLRTSRSVAEAKL